MSETTVCRWLRCKSAYASVPGQPDWRSGESTVEAYGCLATCAPTGPDDGFAHATSCRPGRACFEAPQPGMIAWAERPEPGDGTA